MGMASVWHYSLFTKFALLVGLAPLITAIWFAIRPTERSLASMRPLSLAAIFAAVSNLFVGFANAFVAISGIQTWDAKGFGFASEVIAEVAVPPFIGFAFLTVAWLCVAVGSRRLTHQ